MTATGPPSPIYAGPIGAATTAELQGAEGGLSFVPASAPLIGLNYYDGRFLRADDLNLERRGQRAYVEYSNRAGGPGVVWGYELSGRGTPTLTLAAGLGIAANGRVLHLPVGVPAGVTALLAAPQQAVSPEPGAGFAPCATATVAPSAAIVPGTDLYLVGLAAASALCGQTEVFGRLCDGGCVTATDRPYVVDGVTLVLRPLTFDPLTPPGVTGPQVRLRSQVASTYFAAERAAAAAGSPLSAATLGADLWSAGAPSLAGDDVVPLGVLAWNGSQITMLDMWTARRERMEAPPRAWWAGHLEQRPWPVFLAQVLQFQSQLAGAPAAAAAIPARILVERGFVELPAAGYLPVDPAQADLHRQVQDLMGPGVDLRLCAVRRDQIAHELERAQHMDRISLLRGLADPGSREYVDILVPDGIVEPTPMQRSGLGFTVDLGVGEGAEQVLTPGGATDSKTLLMIGAGRADLSAAINARLVVATSAFQRVSAVFDLLARVLDADAGAVVERLNTMRFGAGAEPSLSLLKSVAARVQAAAVRHRVEKRDGHVVALSGKSSEVAALSLALTVGEDPFELPDHKETVFELALAAYLPRAQPIAVDLILKGFLTRRSGGPNEVAVDVIGLLTLDETGLGIGDVPPTINGRVVLSREVKDGFDTLTVRDENASVAASVGWRGSPVEALGRLGGTLHIPQVPVPLPMMLAAFRAVEDADIARPGGRYHDAAAEALTILAGSHADSPTYAQEQYALLFPTAEDAVTSRVRATTDWVLFRRRRREECEGVALPPQAVSLVTAWVLRAASQDAVDTILAELAEGEWRADDWKQADVAFALGRTTLLTPAQTWRSRYLDADGAARIAFAGYAGAPGTAAATVGVGRLTALVDALDPEVELDPGATVDLVNDPPDTLLVPGTEGSAFLVTYDPDPDPDPDRLDVIAVVLDGPGDELGQAIVSGQVDVVAAAQGRWRPLDEIDAQDADLTRIVEELSVAVTGHGLEMRLFKHVVGWTHEDLGGVRRSLMRKLIKQVVDGLAAALGVTDSDLPVEPVQDVTFERVDGQPAARLFIVLDPNAIG